jgi:hypothetical protein
VRADKMVRLLTAKAELIERHVPPWQRPLARPLLRLWPLSRRIATGTLAAVTGRASLRDSAASWAEIWRRRAEWRGGYRSTPAGPAG